MEISFKFYGVFSLLSSYSSIVDLLFSSIMRFCRKRPKTMGLKKEFENEKIEPRIRAQNKRA